MQNIIEKQRAHFESGATRPLAYRLAALRRLQGVIKENESEISSALLCDLNKPREEAYLCEIGIVLEEIRYHLAHLGRWMRDKRVRTPLAQFRSRSFVSPEPYGVVLVMAPWNYPFQLCIAPLIGAISAGNCAVVKPSAYAPATSRVVAKIIEEAFPPEYITVVEGGRAENNALLCQRFDYIFFTGSVAVGRLVMEAAAKNLTPISLELGGKSPVIVDESADVTVAARRIAFGKTLNAGQTCVAPDYVFVHRKIKERFVAAYQSALAEFFPDGDMTDFPHIVNDKHFDRLMGLLVGERVLLGGESDRATRFIAPTLLDEVSPDAPVMKEEIFGPILPMLTFDSMEEPIAYIRKHPKPLALYLFTRDKAVERAVLDTLSFGGGCINDTVIHLATPHMGFGGVGESGMGSYHGKESFDTFSHRRSIVRKAFFPDLPMRYRPYTEKKDKLIRKFLK